ncbi:hypothetical protein FOG51_03917 [Hanseniaspora uvarum]|nr:hypothetical protein FOG48_02019 [Hanseniaspora uvarum]KAF0271039.1 hypothetical protein FOG51_03917 [Hanseniaspora uvarum]KAF0275072.1 hypothetical protein FOG50_04117 [Hanseniaspora uvarum]GMM39885.1 ATP-dependent RNA helicase [Hanseniaspora uvarum]
MDNNFSKLGCAKWLVEALNAMKITTPTEIQKNCIPEILKGKNCIGGAKTGSGKTIAFAAPMLTEWSKDPCGMFGIVLTPTRELAMQIAEQFSALGSSMNIRISICVGGEDIIKQSLDLQRRPHFIIATPGRLAHHILQGNDEFVNNLKRLKYLVLDEADMLLTNTFSSDLKRCFEKLPSKDVRKTLLFTATMTDQVKSLQDSAENKFFMYETDKLDDVAIPSTLKITYLLLPDHVKEAYLYSILASEEYKDKNCIIFVNRTINAEILRRTLQKLEIRVTSLHSQMPQKERTNAIHRFKAQAARVLIATDVAARGLDIPAVQLVVNYDLPSDPDTYIHRSGRTARAGKKGEALSFITPNDVNRVHAIEERINLKMDEFDKVHDTAVIRKVLQKVTVARAESLIEMDKDGFGEKRKIQELKRSHKKENGKNFRKK